MPEQLEPELWFWQDPDEKYAEDVVNYVKSHGDKELVVLRSCSCPVFNGQLFTEYVFELCQKFQLLQNDRTTFLSCKDHLLALELCISSVKRQNSWSEAQDETDEEVLYCHKAYVDYCLNKNYTFTDEKQKMYIFAYKEFLEHTNCTELWNLYTLLQKCLTECDNKFRDHVLLYKYLLLGSFETEVFISLIKLLATGEVFNITTETPLNASLQENFSEAAFSSNNSLSANISRHLLSLDDVHVIPSSSENSRSATKEYAEDVILSFLGLLVNSRNELFLSRAMTSPIINLSHSAFTDLKHVSHQKEMPMCQTVLSYVTRLRLGGKSYAPSSDCPLHRHLEGLEQFVDLLNQMQTIMEEEKSAESAVKRVINISKKRLLKSKTSLSDSSVEEIAADLIKTSMEMLKRHNSVLEMKRSTQMGHKAFTLLHILVNYRACSESSDTETVTHRNHSHRTPLNQPPLMGYFRTPEEDSCSHEDSRSSVQLKEKIKQDIKVETSSLSYFHSSDSNSLQRSCVNEHTPTKVTFTGCLQDKENCKKMIRENLSAPAQERKALSLKNDGNKSGIKRSILGNISSEKPNKKANSTSASIKKPKTKMKQQIKGQGHITAFFTKKSL